MAKMAGYKVFSKMDFRSAFHQILLEEESRKLTVFYAGPRLMRFKRLTMGSSPASGEMAKALNPLFDDLENVHIIHDDLIIAGKDKDQHDQTLHTVCKRIEDAGMTLNPDKCIIGKDSIPWWGMIISAQGMSPDPEKVATVRNLTPPRNRAELKSFFCMMQSNKEFIPNIARKTTNLRKLLKQHARFKWTKECQQEFKDLIESFREDVLLHHFDPRLNTYIYVDAHRSGVSAILKQGKEEYDSHVVALASRATTPTESRYPQLDLEALSIDFGLRRFRFHIAGGPTTTIITNRAYHASCPWALATHALSPWYI
jgi:hypothetical protein